ncbi:hypothetical protein TRFO_04876 [Tritrichomonas foetus]|uniref:Uncharacterized protein n=1 Tax=Tritrichomonas foetus TaxID=1144522 RepID=A0A1J4KAM6_9EUKA|nr:hypothetical protein TRFO_04876 [Tritrichomonas foetus]|eukprot:OHT08275.1 hypothetical protein TRFO_04876 [Tritrichomonas foetus]
MQRKAMTAPRSNINRQLNQRRLISKKPMNSRPTTSLHKQPKSFLNDAECISLRDSLFKDENYENIETEKLLSLLSHIREYTQWCALQENYRESRRSRDLGINVRAELTRRGTFTKSLDDQKNEVEEKKAKFEEEWAEKKKKFNEETESKLNELRELHAHEARKFERIWTEEMPHRYRKPSNNLLQLKQIEKSLAIAGNIDEADKVHRKAEQLSNQEALKAQETLVVDYRKAKRRLLNKQKYEENNLKDERERYRLVLENKYMVEKSKVDNRNNVVNKRATKLANKQILMDSVATWPTQLPQEKGKQLGTLLPPLVPPNEPRYIELRKRRKEELSKLQDDYHQKAMEFDAADNYY